MAVPRPMPYCPRCCLRGPPKLTNLRCAKWDCDVCQLPRMISRKWRHCLLSSSVTLCHLGPKAALHLPSYTSAHFPATGSDYRSLLFGVRAKAWSWAEHTAFLLYAQPQPQGPLIKASSSQFSIPLRLSK